MDTSSPETQFTPSELRTRAIECWHAGDLLQARDLLSQALAKTPHTETNFRLWVTNNLAMVERSTKRLYEALRLQTEAGHLAGLSDDDFLIGNHYQGLGITNEMIGEREGFEEYADRALIAYEAACHHYGLAGRTRETVNTQSCIAYLFVHLNKMEEALELLERAISTAKTLSDEVLVAELEHTRAQALFKAGNISGALTIATEAANVLRANKRWLVLPDVLKTIEEIAAAMREECEAKREARQIATLVARETM